MRGECEPVPGQTMPKLIVVERDYPHVGESWRALGPLVEQLGTAVKGANWVADEEVTELAPANGRGPRRAWPTDARRWRGSSRLRGDPGAVGHHQRPARGGGLAFAGAHDRRAAGRPRRPRAGDRITFQDAQVQPRTVITSPEWSGIEPHGRRYSPFTTNVEREKPWHTLYGPPALLPRPRLDARARRGPAGVTARRWTTARSSATRALRTGRAARS